MPSTLPILRARRERRLAKQQANESRRRNTFLSAGMILSLLIAALIIITAFAYVNLTRDLPSIQTLPILLNPPSGLLLQPTKIYDRTGKTVLFTFAPDESSRRYIPLSDTNPQHLPQSLADAIIATSDPNFYDHAGYNLASITNYTTPSRKNLSPNYCSSTNRPPSAARCVNASSPRRSRRNLGARRSSSGISTRRTSVAMPSAPKARRNCISENLRLNFQPPSPPSSRR